jgi:ubiquinone/menaquinone biosynthesis C-methylase UbiE
VNTSMRDVLVCPACRGSLAWTDETASCLRCRVDYPVEDGIPVLLANNDEHMEQQASFFNSAPGEFEIARPHGAPRLYRWLIEEKFRRSLSSLDGLIAGATALTVCGGSGMDAEFLALRGASVYLADISLGAATRARARAKQRNFELFPLVADAAALPFPDRSVDLTYVHDGLHHLERPAAGLRETARVARRAISVNEPARAALTTLAVYVGLSELEEDAGNRIERLDPKWVTQELAQAGFEPLLTQRYGMVYRHEPGSISRVLSRPPLFQATTSVIRSFNGLAGGVGNKFTVQAVRPSANPGK